MPSKQYIPAHPIVFVMDFSSDAVEIPEYESDKLTAGNSTCVSVRTIADVDGEEVTVLATTSSQVYTPEVHYCPGLRTP